MHSNVDLSASCPRCLAAAAEMPGGSDGELCRSRKIACGNYVYKL